jgi:predicted DNA-binding transcriptional regulator AlpA
MSRITPQPPARRALHINEFCRAYGVNRDTAYGLIKAGKLPDVKILGRRVIPVDAAEALLRASEPAA